MTLGEFDEMFPDENACKEYLVSRRWPDGVRCPRCDNPSVGKLNWKPFHLGLQALWRYALSVLACVRTIFENTNYLLRTWFKVLYSC